MPSDVCLMVAIGGAEIPGCSIAQLTTTCKLHLIAIHAVLLCNTVQTLPEYLSVNSLIMH